MEVLVYLVPMALALGLLGLGGFLWSLKTGQYDDLDGAAWRAILDEDDGSPVARMTGEKAPEGDKSSGPA
ncbi:MAG: cbb3-type cytochrome oxidase assembly protein CcoS [Xanthobacteraceae bacterium]|jgi:cbb3-type cytochrome oxidase maturation protein